MATNRKNSVLVVNQRYLQPLNLFQEAEIQKHKELGGLINIRTGVRDTDRPLYEYVQLKENLFSKTERPQEMPQPSSRGYVEGFGFYAGETA